MPRIMLRVIFSFTLNSIMGDTKTIIVYDVYYINDGFIRPLQFATKFRLEYQASERRAMLKSVNKYKLISTYGKI